MKDFRLGRNETAHYSSFEEMRKAYGLPTLNKKTKDENKLEAQQQKFLSKHRCKACNEPMMYIGGNQMVCKNEKCRGIKFVREDKEGNEIVTYLPSYDLLNELGSEIANNIFS